MTAASTYHGTAIARDGEAVLLRGPSGAGKSDLAFRMMDRGWQLVGDDQVILRAEAGVPIVEPAPRLAGLIELYGIGVVRRPFLVQAQLILVVDLVTPDAIERVPTFGICSVAGIDRPLLNMTSFQGSTPAKLDYVMRHGLEGNYVHDLRDI